MQPANLIVLVLLLGGFYLLILRPAKARQRQQLELQRSVTPGVDVMTTSGMFGSVTEVDDDAVHLEIAPGTVVRFTKAAIARVVSEPAEDEADDLDEDDYDDEDDDHDPEGDEPGTHSGSAEASSDVEPPDAAGGSASSAGSGTPDDPRDRAAG